MQEAGNLDDSQKNQDTTHDAQKQNDVDKIWDDDSVKIEENDTGQSNKEGDSTDKEQILKSQVDDVKSEHE